MRTATAIQPFWLLPLLMIVVVVVTVVALNRVFAPRSDSVLVKFTYGPTVISTQVVKVR